MPLEPRLYLNDMIQVGEAINTFTSGKDFTDYETDLMLRSAVERQLEIVGEALNQLLIHAPHLEPRFSYRREIKNFRNILAHEYMRLDHAIVWGILEKFLPTLMQETKDILLELQ